jgi:phenylacetate-CoA ligase
MNIRKIVKSMPSPLRNTLRYAYGMISPRFRYGKVFWDTYRFLGESQYWSKDKLEEYQFMQLKNLVLHAYENVPFYSKLWKKHNVNPAEIKDFDAFKTKIPYITKDDIRKNIEDMVATNFPDAKKDIVTTSGSTGEPLSLYLEKGRSRPSEFAFIATQWKRIGYKVDDYIIALRGEAMEKGEIFYKDPSERYSLLSSFCINKDNIKKYYDILLKSKPYFLHVFPSSLELLSKYFLEQGYDLSGLPLKGIFCASEKLYDFQRKLFSDLFKVPVYGHYGHTEICVLAGECEVSKYLHVFSEYGYTEIIDSGNIEITEENSVGEIVATGFNNNLMPLIRYRTGDFATIKKDNCKCGRNYKLFEEVIGRSADFALDANNEMIPIVPLVFPIHDKYLRDVIRFQLIQEKIGEIEILLHVRDSSDKGIICKNLLADLKSRVGDRLKFDIRFTPEIPLSNNGKYLYFIKKV